MAVAAQRLQNLHAARKGLPHRHHVVQLAGARQPAAAQRALAVLEWRRFDAADVQPGLFWCKDLCEARRQLMAADESLKVHQQPGAILRAKAEAGHEDPRAAGGARGAAEWCKALNQKYRGQRLAGLAHEIFLKLLKAKAPRGGEAEDLAALDGRQGLPALPHAPASPTPKDKPLCAPRQLAELLQLSVEEVCGLRRRAAPSPPTC